MPVYPLSNLRRDVIDDMEPERSHNPRCSHGASGSFIRRIRILLEKKLSDIADRFFLPGGKVPFRRPAGLTRSARLAKRQFCVTLKPEDSPQAMLERIDLLERKLADAEARVASQTGGIEERAWMPLVKVSAAPTTATTTEPMWGCGSRDEEQAVQCAGLDLAGSCVLCVGGRARLYPAYRRMVETSGGNLLIYRSGLPNGADQLPALLAHADMVVCPVDCINHYTYFAVKRYCKHSGKPCVLLDRSGLPTFRKGVETLSALAASLAVSSEPV
ncbi:DUF2325 domain-containing protein [Nitrosospira briensis]|uniref:DUF2325 domain-containing protein n=1 Tax=Nitrosospira briensis TaxID=35799 RepID=UPI0008EF1BF1|nr:DUF2325 domain-containing protein [Nitrosospira briensis]SFO39815.1 hypothetical protein SAMN05216332_11384 [Nitrosospira briensis]